MKTERLIALITAAFASVILSTSARAESPATLQTGPQMPGIAAPGGIASYSVTFTHAGLGSLGGYLSVAGLPDGASTSFVASMVDPTNHTPGLKISTLVVGVAPSTPAGSYPFTVTARHGSSPTVLVSSNILVVGAAPVVVHPLQLNNPVLLPDDTVLLTGSGDPSKPLLIQATFDLSTGSWETIAVKFLGPDGLFSFVDQDAPNFPARFYRLAQ